MRARVRVRVCGGGPPCHRRGGRGGGGARRECAANVGRRRCQARARARASTAHRATSCRCVCACFERSGQVCVAWPWDALRARTRALLRRAGARTRGRGQCRTVSGDRERWCLAWRRTRRSSKGGAGFLSQGAAENKNSSCDPGQAPQYTVELKVEPPHILSQSLPVEIFFGAPLAV